MKFKSNTKQRMKSVQGLRSFKNTLPTKVKKIINKKGQIYSRTLDNWKIIVGEKLFKICYPKSIKSANPFSKSCLNIMVKRGHEVDLQYSKDEIIKKLNIFFGYNVVETVKFLTFEDKNNKYKEKKILNVTKSNFIKKISNIKNEKIKNSLIELTKQFKRK